MKLDVQRLRLARVSVVAVAAVLGLAAAPAVARAAGPERAPVKAPAKLGPEPAPVAHATVPSTATTSTATTSTTTPSTSRPVIASTTSAPPQQRPATSARPKTHPPAPPKATHKVKAAARALAQTFQHPATRLAIAAVPAGTNESNRLLFLGGLALLVLVLGDAAFLAMSARVIRDQR